MFQKLSFLEDHYSEIASKLSDPTIISDQEQYKSLMKEYSDITLIVEKYREYNAVVATIAENRELLDTQLDPDFRQMVEEEFKEAKERQLVIEAELKVLLLPKDPNDDKNVIVEIRGGAGGEEAALFANSLYRMYAMYAESRRWKVEVMNLNETELGGIKEISFQIEATGAGQGAYSRLKYESGVHRVQRVPDTESSGRVHTSTVTVAVLPEVEDVEISFNATDLKIDTFRASGAGGQHINKTDSAIRVTHLPTGLVVECQDQRSQYKNKDQALKILRARLYERSLSEQNAKIAQERKSQVGTGDRSERIRTYNFPQGRVSDHRIGLTLYRIDEIMNGDLDEIIDALITQDRAQMLQGSSEE